MIQRYLTAAAGLDRSAAPLLPTLARLVFAGVLAGYFWASALTKLDGPSTLSLGAFAQIYPRQLEAAGYDASALGLIPHLIVWAGTLAELALPLLLILGLATRLAALGMAGFIAVQSLTDIFGHQIGATGLGIWFDRAPDALIADQRALWLMLLAVLFWLGAGPVSLDAALRRRNPHPTAKNY